MNVNPLKYHSLPSQIYSAGFDSNLLLFESSLVLNLQRIWHYCKRKDVRLPCVVAIDL